MDWISSAQYGAWFSRLFSCPSLSADTLAQKATRSAISWYEPENKNIPGGFGRPVCTDVLLNGNELFKGALTEQYVLQQLKTVKGLNIYYWTAERGTAEVDFVVDTGSDVIPIEVKAEVNLQAKSLKVCRVKYQPKLSVSTSMADYKKED